MTVERVEGLEMVQPHEDAEALIITPPPAPVEVEAPKAVSPPKMLDTAPAKPAKEPKAPKAKAPAKTAAKSKK